MKDLLKGFESLADVVEKIDNLVEQAGKTRGRVEKRKLLQEAQDLMDAYEEHCQRGGNDKKQFNPVI